MENDSNTLNKPYLFVHLQDNILTNETLDTINNSDEVHFYLENKLNAEIINQIISLPKKTYYMYVFNEETYQFCINNNIIPHLCFSGNDLFTSSLLKYIDKNLECFWFPGMDNIFHDIEKYTKYLNKLNKPICISISDIFNPDVNHEQSRLWIKALLKSYNNPLFQKEKHILEENSCYKNNYYLIQQNNEITIKKIVLGIFGDCVIDENFEINNLKSIIINRDCSNCDYQELCINKGLGYSIYKNKYKGCIGIKLFNQS